MQNEDVKHIAEALGIRRVEFVPGVIIYLATENEMLALCRAAARHGSDMPS